MRNIAKKIYHRGKQYAPGLLEFLCRIWKAIEGPRDDKTAPQACIKIAYEQRETIQNGAYYSTVFSKKPNEQVDPKHMDIAFILPDPIEGSGGHRNIYRAIKYLHDFGHTLTVYYTHTTEPADVVKARISDWFYDMTDIPYICYDGTLGYHDVAVATWWETAYMLDNNRAKVKYPCYFVQDFEPSFYPVNSKYILAENTYRLGFSHICSGRWCKDFLQTKYHAEAEYFQFPVDKSIYNMLKPREQKRKNVLFFAKPEMDRRCYEIGIMALEELHKLEPEIEIILYGSSHVNVNQLKFPATCKGLLPTLEDLADLYRNADLGIVFSTTNPSLVPYEMLSCGCPVVDFDIDGAAEKYGGDAGRVFLCGPEPIKMAKQIANIMKNENLRKQCAENGRTWVEKEFPSETEMAHLVEKMIQNKVTHGELRL